MSHEFSPYSEGYTSLESAAHYEQVPSSWAELASDIWRPPGPDGRSRKLSSKTNDVPDLIVTALKEIATGSRTDDKFNRVADIRMEKPALPAESDAKGQWARLRDLAVERIADIIERTLFTNNMVYFWERARKQGLSAEEVGKTFSEVGRLLESRDDAYMSDISRIRLAKEVMSQAAKPTLIRQGHHNTCMVAAIEARAYTRHPSAAAGLVAQSALAGWYGAGNGAVVWHKDYPASLMPDIEALKRESDSDDRSYASQIFQVTAVNVHYAANPFTWIDSYGKRRTAPAGTIRYEQVMPRGPDDNGERLMDYSDRTNPREVVLSDGYPARWPILDGDQAVMISNAITREYAYDTMIAMPGVFDTSHNFITADSEENFSDLLRGLKQSARFPVLVVVDTNKEPFWKDSGEGLAGGSGGSHVVTVTDYRNGMVEVDNQWGEHVDHIGNNAIPVGDLYKAMFKRKGIV